MVQFSTIPGLTVGDDRVAWDGGEFRFADVESISTPGSLKSMIRPRINLYSLLIRALLVDEGGVVLHGADGREIRFVLKSGFNFPGQGRRIAELRELKQVLIARTYPHRMQRYLRSLREAGHFEHGGYVFHRDGSVYSNGERVFGLKDPGFSIVHRGHELALMPQKSAVAYLTSKLHTVSLRNNGDCFLHLLDAVYGLRFRDGGIAVAAT
jgi:hypothetical protein